MATRFGHINLIARDWRRLVNFYREVFGCMPVPPARDLHGEALEKGSGIPGASLQGMHLRLPGHGADGPTLEVFSYAVNDPLGPGGANRTGFGHIAFQVDDVEESVRRVLAAGGTKHGELVTTRAGDRQVSWIYLRDPEGNLIELQRWSDTG